MKSAAAQNDFRPIIVAAYFGRLPEHLPLWIASCAFNACYTWRLLTDQVSVSTHLAENVVAEPFSLAEFSRRTEAATGVRPAMERGYKICDLRPLFGEILADFCEGFSHWGHCDLGVIFGLPF